nr:iron transporter [uncultured Duganella sp.]
MIRLSPAALWRWQVGARALIAIFGGYALAALASARLATLCALIMPRPDAALTGMLLSFALYAAIVIWTFSASTLRRACAVLLLAAGLLVLL